jgi:hypothetical protein
MLTNAGVCWHMLTYAELAAPCTANIFEELGLYKEMVECYVAQDEDEEVLSLLALLVLVQKYKY